MSTIRCRLTPVAVLTGEGVFVSRDTHVAILPVSQPGSPRKTFLISANQRINAEFGVTADQRVAAFSDGRRLLWVDTFGRCSTAVEPLGLFDPAEDSVRDSEIGFSLAVSDSLEQLCFTLLSDVGGPWSICNVHVGLGTVVRLLPQRPRSFDTDVDFTRGCVVYAAISVDERPEVAVHNFTGAVDTLQVNHWYYYSRLMRPDRAHVLLSTHERSNEGRVALLDLSSGTEDVLPFEGHSASWCGRDSVIFRRKDGAITRYDLRTRVMTDIELPDSRSFREGYCGPPVCSLDGRYVAVDAVDSPGGAPQRVGTTLMDLARDECRFVEGAWLNKAWLLGLPGHRHDEQKNGTETAPQSETTTAVVDQRV